MTLKLFKKHLKYDPETGLLTWKFRKKGRKFTRPAGTLSHGYLAIMIEGKKYLAHRVAWTLFNNKNIPDNREIDHIDGNRCNNRFNNIRLVTTIQNRRNQRSRNGQTGVYRQYYTKKWIAQIGVDYETIYLGVFDKKEDALAARKNAEIKYGFHENHGRTNTTV